MTLNLGFSRRQRFALLISAIAVGASVYMRTSARCKHNHGSWNRLDRNAPMYDPADGSFPASDPPSSVPAG
jgi:hypothetical protein